MDGWMDGWMLVGMSVRMMYVLRDEGGEHVCWIPDGG